MANAITNIMVGNVSKNATIASAANLPLYHHYPLYNDKGSCLF